MTDLLVVRIRDTQHTALIQQQNSTVSHLKEK